MANKVQFYIPNITMWNWRLVSPIFVKLQLSRCQLSFSETDNALENLNIDVRNIEQEIRGAWATASATHMRAFEARLKEVRAERKRIMFVRLKLQAVIDRMTDHLAELRDVS